MKKDASEADKDAKKMLREKVPGLMDATGKDRSKCILFLAEGLCMSEETKVRVTRNGEDLDVAAKDVEVGDLVVTHNRNMKPVVHTTKKVAETVAVTTPLGVERFTPEHRLLAFNTLTSEFGYVAVGELDKTIHKLVKHK